jgi:hypothetical protein
VSGGLKNSHTTECVGAQTKIASASLFVSNLIDVKIQNVGCFTRYSPPPNMDLRQTQELYSDPENAHHAPGFKHGLKTI